ncbi:MAG: glycerol-3-phosphate 1-O-acyltransferase PlsY [Planctomycetaceae bacterium]|nr:glycerol-3-phosphate 1-O-acyltransferase PlsY [Planctomycetaceae bacterium]
MFAVLVVFILVGFLVGGIPFGYLLGRCVLKDDIRRHGSGNIGATNVARVIGWKWGGLVLLLDALKGMGPTLGAMWWCRGHDLENVTGHVMVATGVAAIIGHMYPVYLKLRGGKGVATGLGVVAVVGPLPAVCALAVFLLLALTVRVIALASMAAAVTYGVSQLCMLGTGAFESKNLSLTLFAVTVPALIVWRHRSNISRMLTGAEPRMRGATPKESALPAQHPIGGPNSPQAADSAHSE